MAEIGCTFIDTNYDYELEVFECDVCGFNIGLDAAYLRKAEKHVNVPCPSCDTMLFTLVPDFGND